MFGVGPEIRFYAIVSLLSLDDSILGGLAVNNEAPRTGLSPEHFKIMQDVADMTMRYLESTINRRKTARGERMIRALASFAASSTSSRDAAIPSAELPSVDAPAAPVEKKVEDNSKLQPSPAKALDLTSAPSSADKVESQDMAIKAGLSKQPRKETPHPQERLLLTGTKPMFARAANILREGCDLDGVVMVWSPRPSSYT